MSTLYESFLLITVLYRVFSPSLRRRSGGKAEKVILKQDACVASVRRGPSFFRSPQTGCIAVLQVSGRLKAFSVLQVEGLRATAMWAMLGLGGGAGSGSNSATGEPWGLDPRFSVSGAQSPLPKPVAFRRALDYHMQDCRGFAQTPGRSAELGTQVGEVGCL